VSVSDGALSLLTALELRESALLSWGATGGQWTEAELRRLAEEHGQGQPQVAELLDAALLVETPTGGYRTRSAETVRILASLRQSFPSRPVTDGRSLVLDFRFLHRPRRRPERDVDRALVLDDIRSTAGAPATRVAEALLPPQVSGFQRRATRRILRALTGNGATALMVTAGTGSGKSLAFYLPVLSHIADLKAAKSAPSVKALALYPRNELLKDQLRTLVTYSKRCYEQGLAPISIGTWFGPTPDDTRYLLPEPGKEWRHGIADSEPGFIHPFVTCTIDSCDGQLVWLRSDIAAARERLICDRCGDVTDERFIRLTRRASVSSPPDLMLTTTESLNRQLASPRNLPAFGVTPATLKAVLLDELHIYEGTTGAQNAYLFRRLRNALGRNPVWVALSATLQRAEDFLAQCVGVPPDRVELVSPEPSELREAGAEYLVALRHDPTSGTGTLSTTIQTAMALTRCLDVLRPSPFEHAPSSGGVVGRKAFAFTDKLDITNRLYWDLMNAEGWAFPGRALSRNVLSLAHLRSEGQDRLPAQFREAASDRDADGQWWWLAERLGHGIGIDSQLEIGRTSSQDRGVNDDAEIIVATSTLEIGFDDAQVGAVIQHKAPHDVASFVQRKGRAGRDPRTRPWTIAVLSDWGRDQAAWHAYDALFDPELPPKTLPLDNRYVQRIQSVYVLLDWLSREVRAYATGASVWSDMTGPAEILSAKPAEQERIRNRQQQARNVLEALLTPGPTRERLRLFLRTSLGLQGERANDTVDSLFWDGPRSLLLVVVPTVIRRLRDNWLLEEPAATDPAVRHRVPLRDFAPGNLFDDLLATDVAFGGPGIDEQADSPFLPALRTLRDFMPGTVSRHFGVRVTDKRHWIPLPSAPTIDVEAAYGAVPHGLVRAGEIDLALFGPARVTLSSVPREVRDYSRVEPVWETVLEPVGTGLELALPRSARTAYERVLCHIHARGDGIRIVRFARRATGALFNPAQLDVDVTFCDAAQSPVALGSEMIVDGISVHTVVPTPAEPDAQERTEWLAWKILHDSALPPSLNRFTRDTLGQAAQVIWARELMEELEPAGLTDEQWAEELKHAAFSLGRLRPDGRLINGHDIDDDGDPSAFEGDDWLDSALVHEAVRRALAEARATNRTPGWLRWWTQRYTLTATNVLLDALANLANGLDKDSLIIDSDPDDDTLAWITETGPGGVGAIESCMRAIRDAPELLSYALATASAPSDLETLDDELVAIIRQEDGDLASLRTDVIESWDRGHDVAQASLAAFFERLSTLGHRAGRAATTSLSTRLLGPGAHPELMDAVAGWVDAREVLRLGGLAASSRVLAAVLSSRTSDDDVLHLPGDSDRQRRARSIANLLWPWGSDVSRNSVPNWYADQPNVAPWVFRQAVNLLPTAIDVETWDATTREAIHEALVSCREVRLRFDRRRPSQLRSALLDLQVTPVEDESLFVHPTLVAILDVAGRTEAWLRLWESAV
jgi:hypothetical protein